MRNRGALAAAAAVLLVTGGWVVGMPGASAVDTRGPSPSAKGTVTYQRGSAERGVATPAAIPRLSESGTVYHAIRPCRIVDTRKTLAGALAANSSRSFRAIADDLTFQGGSPTGCNVPSTANAILINVVAVASQGNGNLRAWAYLEVKPDASLLNFTKGVNIANAASVPICRDLDSVLGLCDQDFNIRAEGAATHAVVDVMGYYEGPMAAKINSNGTVFAAAYSLIKVVKFGTGNYEVEFDRDISSCAVTATVASHTIGFQTGEAAVSVQTSTPSAIWVGTSTSGGIAANLPFTVSVAC